MNLEEKLKAKSFTKMESDNYHVPTMHLHKPALFLDDALSIIQQEIDEACKKAKIEECEYWREIIFSPEQQAIKPTISLTDFQLRIVELSPKER